MRRMYDVNSKFFETNERRKPRTLTVHTAASKHIHVVIQFAEKEKFR